MLKRIFDIAFSSLIILFLLPLMFFVYLTVFFTSKGGSIYKQIRIGKNQKAFRMYKFRSMRIGSDKKERITVGMKDSRVTKIGYFIRKYKIDELPQFFNVLFGTMSVVGPRPEVEEYIKYYTKEQLQIFQVKPGLTDFASLKYFRENEVLESSENPQKTYLEEVMPEKLKLNLEYVKQQSLYTDFKIIFLTIKKIIIGK